MQTLEVIRTIKWIDSLFDKEVKNILLELPLVFTKEESTERERKDEDFQSFLRVPVELYLAATHELAKVIHIIIQNHHAVTVLNAFDLGALMNKTTPAYLAISILKGPTKEDSAKEFNKKITNMAKGWYKMMGCVEPLEAITIPKELVSDTPPESIISFEIRYDEERKPRLATFAEAVTLFETAYSTVGRIYAEKDYRQLSVINVDSGSTIRVDCEGVAEIIKPLKEFIIEAWHKLRHKRVEEVVEANHAVLLSFEVMEKLSSLKQNKSIQPEEAELLRRALVESALGLFERRALIVGVPEQETVDNNKLLAGFSPKLLTGPKDEPSQHQGDRRRSKPKTKR